MAPELSGGDIQLVYSLSPLLSSVEERHGFFESPLGYARHLSSHSLDESPLPCKKVHKNGLLFPNGFTVNWKF